MRKVYGFKMKLGDWANEIEPEELLELSAEQVGWAQTESLNCIKSKKHISLPSNIMYTYNQDTTIMGFRFDEDVYLDDLPIDFIDSANGIVEGESNLELVYER